MSDRVLFILGSCNKLTNGDPTGWFLPEAAHPYYAISPHFQVDWASIDGGKAPLDPASVEMFKEDKECQKFQNDPEAQKMVSNTLKISDVDPSKYKAIFIVGGHAPLFESGNASLKKLASSFYESGKLVSSVCHGPAALTEVTDKNGKNIFSGRRVTGFSNAEEEAVKKTDVVPYLLEDRFKEVGAKYEKASEPWGVHVVQDGTILTGQNPASAGPLGEAMVKYLQAHA